jgi:DNA segregation ATPase FtsK/SpoIIIE and related proteins
MDKYGMIGELQNVTEGLGQKYRNWLLRKSMGDVPVRVREVLNSVYPEYVGKQKKLVPLIIHEGRDKTNDHKWFYVFSLPPDLHYEKFKKDCEKLIAQRVGGQCFMSKEGRSVKMQVSDLELEKLYHFKFNPKAHMDKYLPIPFGYSTEGEIVEDLSMFPYLFIAGNPFGGKSNEILNIIASLLLASKHNPKSQCLIFVIDYKKVDFTDFEDYIYLFQDDDYAKTRALLEFMRMVIRERSKILKQYKAKNWHKVIDRGGNMPWIVIIADELTEMQDKECQQSYNAIARMGRAAGICLIGATQRPSADMWQYEKFSNTRQLFDARLAFHLPDTSSSHIALGDGYSQAAYLPTYKGRAIYKWDGLKEVQTMKFPEEEDEIAKILNRIKGIPTINPNIYNAMQIEESSNLLLPRQSSYRKPRTLRLTEYEPDLFTSFFFRKQ